MSALRNWPTALMLASALALVGCGSSATSASTDATSTTTSAPTSTSGAAVGTAPAPDIAAIPVAERSPAGTSGSQPTVIVPTGPAPSQLESADLIVGTGPAAKDGDALTVQYVLATYSSRQVVQSSWSSSPYTFTLGAGQVITGWDHGVVGMKAGGRRELIIPPSLGYGSTSPGAGIAANDTLVFVIDLLKVG